MAGELLRRQATSRRLSPDLEEMGGCVAMLVLRVSNTCPGGGHLDIAASDDFLVAHRVSTVMDDLSIVLGGATL